MFNTLKLDRETYEMQNIREAYDPVSARSSSHQACDRCHEKKLKCSGEKTGCDRCVANQLPCRFTRCTSRGSRRGKHNRHRSGEPSAREESNTRSSSQKSRSWRSRSSQASIPSTSRFAASSSGDYQTSSTKSTSSPEQHEHDDSEAMLDRINPELFRLEDGFSFPDIAMAESAYAVTSTGDTYPHITMATTSAGSSASHYQTSAGWFNSVLSHGGSGYPDPSNNDEQHEFDPYQYHQDYRHRWPVSESG